MKRIKKIVIIIVSIIVCYGIYIGVEVYRFSNNSGSLPLIQVSSINTYIDVNSNVRKEKYKGVGYTIEYEYISEQKNNSDYKSYNIISGKMKLFDKILLVAWIS